MAEKIKSENMNYIKNKNLLEELKVYEDTGEKTEELGRMFLLLAQRYSDRGNFAGYTWKDDMICEAVLTCLRYMHNFKTDIDKPNPFAYFSRIIHNAFLNYIAKQKTHSKIKDICYKNIDFITPDCMREDPKTHFDLCAIDYQSIRGNKKKKRKKAKK